MNLKWCMSRSSVPTFEVAWRIDTGIKFALMIFGCARKPTASRKPRISGTASALCYALFLGCLWFLVHGARGSRYWAWFQALGEIADNRPNMGGNLWENSWAQNNWDGMLVDWVVFASRARPERSKRIRSKPSSDCFEALLRLSIFPHCARLHVFCPGQILFISGLVASSLRVFVVASASQVKCSLAYRYLKAYFLSTANIFHSTQTWGSFQVSCHVGDQ